MGSLKRAWLLVVIGFLLYVPSLANHFVWDDEEQVVANTAVHSLSNIPELLAGSTFNSGGSDRLGGLYYKPLMSVSFAVIYSMFGPSPWAFHLFQIGLHIGTTLLLYLVFLVLWGRNWVAWSAALLFLIHPQNVETVVYISSLQDTLYMFFGMLGLTWIMIRDDQITWGDLGFAGVCLFLALLGKETGGLFAILIGLYLFLFRNKLDGWRWAKVVVGVMAIYLYLRLGVAQVGLDKNMFTPMATLPLWVRLGNVPALVWHYLSEWVWPQNLAISQHWVNREPGLVEWMGSLGLVIGWMAVVNRTWARRELVLMFFWGWFGMALAFHSQIFPLDLTVADRWFYLPMAGLIGTLGSIWVKLKFKTKWSKFFVILVGVMVILLIGRSSVRIRNWRDGLSLYQHDIEIMQDSFDLENNLGVELYRVGEKIEAKKHFARSTELSPGWWTNWNNLGVSMEEEGNLRLAQEYYDQAIKNGQYYLAYGNYARVLLKQQRWQEARLFLEKSLKLYPNNSTLIELYRYERENSLQGS